MTQLVTYNEILPALHILRYIPPLLLIWIPYRIKKNIYIIKILSYKRKIYHITFKDIIHLCFALSWEKL